MPAKAATPPTFSGPELAKLLALIKGADSVELKLTIPEQHQRSAVAALGMDPLDAQIRQVVFFDTPYPDGSRVLELSTRCGTADAFQVAAEIRAFLASRSVEISGEQETKTRKALTYFARTMADAAG
jgi:hypothetical protein